MIYINKLNQLVKEMLETHKGGEIFFDNLDKSIQENTLIVDTLINTIPDIESKNIILSGGFGRFFKQYIELLNIKCSTLIAVEGGLRKDNVIQLDNLNILKNKEFIFIDDSFYSGETRNVIKRKLEENNSILTKTYVVYDGSKIKKSDVISLYRYY